MIQRIQTIFLFLVAVAMLSVTTTTIWEQVNPDQTQKIKLTAWNLSTYAIENGQELRAGKDIAGGVAIVGAGISNNNPPAIDGAIGCFAGHFRFAVTVEVIHHQLRVNARQPECCGPGLYATGGCR